MINGHHLSDVLLDYVRKGDFGIPVHVRVEETLLDTGGGIVNVADFWDDRSFVVVNGDILTSINIQEVLNKHEISNAWATLVLTDEPRFNCVQTNSEGHIVSFNSGPGLNLAFTGIQVVSPQVLTEIPRDTPVSIIACYQEMIDSGKKVMSHVVLDHFWRELGSLDRYMGVHQEFFGMSRPPLPGIASGGRWLFDSSTKLAEGVRLQGMVCIGAQCHVGEGAVVQDSILWDHVQVRPGCSIKNSMVGDGALVKESIDGEVLV
jgi:mannose-1-phosphate guanylyltransferase